MGGKQRCPRSPRGKSTSPKASLLDRLDGRNAARGWFGPRFLLPVPQSWPARAGLAMDERDIAEERDDYRRLKAPRDDRGPLSRPHLLSPRRASDTTLAPLHLLQNKRRGSVTDPSFHLGSSSWRQPDLPRRSLDSPQRPQSHRHSPHSHVDYSRTPRLVGPPPSPVRHWSQGTF